MKFLKCFHALVLSVLVCFGANAQISDFSADFESIDPVSPSAISDLGFIVFGNVFDASSSWCYGYGTFDAPNSAADGVPAAFSGIVEDVGGEAASLNIFSDYENGDHANGKFVQGNCFREVMPAASDVGRMVMFQFDYRLADAPNGVDGASTAGAFVKVIDQNNGFALVDEFIFDTTAAGPEFATGSITVEIIPVYEGLLFQYGFFATATNYEASGIYYDNLSVGEAMDCILADVNTDGAVDLLDVAPFVAAINGTYICEADVNEDGTVDLLDVAPFVAILTGG